MSFKFFMSMMVFVKQSGELIFPQHASSTNRVEMVHMRTGYNGWFLITLTIRHFSERILIGAIININLTTQRKTRSIMTEFVNFYKTTSRALTRFKCHFPRRGRFIFFLFFTFCVICSFSNIHIFSWDLIIMTPGQHSSGVTFCRHIDNGKVR